MPPSRPRVLRAPPPPPSLSSTVTTCPQRPCACKRFDTIASHAAMPQQPTLPRSCRKVPQSALMGASRQPQHSPVSQHADNLTGEERKEGERGRER
ncbi:hypothetical protein DAI22_04g300350 [Oryza sativa Japonica Group]|nr:hypothetical protein DAI22_04g300350 [Oryza sativa Japonica Group]